MNDRLEFYKKCMTNNEDDKKLFGIVGLRRIASLRNLSF